MDITITMITSESSEQTNSILLLLNALLSRKMWQM